MDFSRNWNPRNFLPAKISPFMVLNMNFVFDILIYIHVISRHTTISNWKIWKVWYRDILIIYTSRYRHRNFTTAYAVATAFTLFNRLSLFFFWIFKFLGRILQFLKYPSPLIIWSVKEFTFQTTMSDITCGRVLLNIMFSFHKRKTIHKRTPPFGVRRLQGWLLLLASK